MTEVIKYLWENISIIIPIVDVVSRFKGKLDIKTEKRQKVIEYCNQALYYYNSKETEKAISKYESALLEISYKEFPYEYSILKESIGITYLLQYEMKNNEVDITCSIENITSALNTKNSGRSQTEDALAKANLGCAYAYLAKIRSRRENIEKSIELTEEAVLLLANEKDQSYYIKTLYNIAYTYLDYSKVHDPEESLKHAIEYLELALESQVYDKDPYFYSICQNGLGNGHIFISDCFKGLEREAHIEEGIKHLKNALKTLNVENYSKENYMVQSNLGVAYSKLAALKEPHLNYEKAFLAYDLAFKVASQVGSDLDISIILDCIGNAKGQSSEILDGEEKLKSLLEALECYEKSLKIRTITKYQIYFSETQYGIGSIYYGLSKLQNEEINLKKSISAYQEALNVLTPSNYSYGYGITQTGLAISHLALFKIQQTMVNLENCINSSREALKVFNRSAYAWRYVQNLNHLSEAYLELFYLENKKEYLECSIDANKELASYYESEGLNDRFLNMLNALASRYLKMAYLENGEQNTKIAIDYLEKALEKTDIDKNQDLYFQLEKNLQIAFLNLFRLKGIMW